MNYAAVAEPEFLERGCFGLRVCLVGRDIRVNPPRSPSHEHFSALVGLKPVDRAPAAA